MFIIEDIKDEMGIIEQMEEEDSIKFEDVDFYRYYYSYLKFMLRQILK